jgi:hypothetical protein
MVRRRLIADLLGVTERSALAALQERRQGQTKHNDLVGPMVRTSELDKGRISMWLQNSDTV